MTMDLTTNFQDPIILMDKFTKGEISEKELREELHKLRVHSCFTCKFGDKLYKKCLSCVRYPVPRVNDNWEKGD